MSSPAALLLLFGSLVGSYFNIPVAQLPGEQIVAAREVAGFGMHYVVPVVVEWPGTVIAVNVGGAVIPTLLSLYLLVKNDLWIRGIVTTVIVAAIVHMLAYPVPGVGIAVPIFVPPVATAIVAVLFARPHSAPLAHLGGRPGTGLGPRPPHRDAVEGPRAPVRS